MSLEGEYLRTPAERLAAQEQRLQGCRRCKLCEGRSTIVFGSGNPQADLVVIGEGPGADEDAQGLPFVGRAGQLRGRLHQYGEAVLIPTFHPAFLLRNPGQDYKRMAWDDLKLAKREYDARRTRDR